MSATSAPFGLRPAFHPSGLDRAQALAGVFVDITLRVFALESFNLLRKRLNLRQKQGMGKQAPTINKHRRPRHSSSSGSAVLRSTLT